MHAQVQVTALTPEVESFIGKPRQVLIDGRWVAAKSGKTFEVFDPSTGRPIALAAACEAADVDAAVRAARKAFDDGPWPRMSPSARGRIIWKIGDLILENLDELAQLESLDNGKPYRRRARGGRPARRGFVSLHGRVGDEARGQHDPASRCLTRPVRNTTHSRGVSRLASSRRSSRGISRC